MPRAHADQINLWAENEDAEVWFKSIFGFWSMIEHSKWLPDVEYAVVLPEYKEAWQAWLDGELQYRESVSSEWKDCSSEASNVPKFNTTDVYYRRKPKIKTPTLKDVGKECFFISDHSSDFRHKGILCGVATNAVEFRFMDERGGLWEYAELTGE